MRSFAEVAATLARRNDRLRGLSYGVSVLSVGACSVFLMELVSVLLRRTLPGWTLSVVLASFLLAGTVAFVWGRRIPSSKARLLLEVDVRLGLDARLSSLHEIDSRGGSPVLSERLFRDLRRLTPNWSRALPIPRRLRLLAAATGVFTACAVLLLVLAPAPERSAGERPGPVDVAAQASPAGADQVAADNAASPETDLGTSDAPNTPSSTGGTQRSLSEILAELRPALSSAAANASAATSEDAAAALHEELQKLQERLATNSQPLSPEEEQTLHQAAATSPDLAKAVEDAAASSDLNALRETISQILSASTAPTTAAAAQTTRTDVRPTAPSDTQSSAQPNASPSATPPDASSAGASNTTEGGSASASVPPPDDSLFESGVGDVAPVAAPLALGEEGALSSYVTQGVPVEQTTDPISSERSWTLDPDQVRSVLSARNLPAGAADIIRDYFQRITEENP
ncbi:MAG: hypothetical protein NTX23_03790 [Candidatus Bipolaricaulota bacterium]|nr:hypothetical protein [Candidatus Bipolaricaulota bacterium]